MLERRVCSGSSSQRTTPICAAAWTTTSGRASAIAASAIALLGEVAVARSSE
jgi:hypothetical protein